MSQASKEKKIKEIADFLENNGIDPRSAVEFKHKFETFYYVGGSRRFAEETRIGFNLIVESDIHVSMHEINDIDFETAFSVAKQEFVYDDDKETLTITGTDSSKHAEPYRIVINSIYLDF